MGEAEAAGAADHATAEEVAEDDRRPGGKLGSNTRIRTSNGVRKNPEAAGANHRRANEGRR